MQDGVVFIFFSIVGLLLYFQGLKSYSLKRLIENVPKSAVRGMAMGLVEIQGNIVPLDGKVLLGPLTQEACVYYKLTVEAWRRSGKSKNWIEIYKEEAREPFYLKDATGQVMVEPEGAEIEIPSDQIFQTGKGTLPARAINFLAASREKKSFSFSDKEALRLTEYHISPGDFLYILGSAGDNPIVEEGSAHVRTEDILIQKGENKLPFYIADKEEKIVVGALAKKAWFGILIGMLMAVGFLAAALASFNLL